MKSKKGRALLASVIDGTLYIGVAMAGDGGDGNRVKKRADRLGRNGNGIDCGVIPCTTGTSGQASTEQQAPELITTCDQGPTAVSPQLPAREPADVPAGITMEFPIERQTQLMVLKPIEIPADVPSEVREPSSSERSVTSRSTRTPRPRLPHTAGKE